MGDSPIKVPGKSINHVLCTACGEPSLLVTTYWWLTPDGLTQAPAHLLCTECGRQALAVGRCAGDTP